MKFHENNQLPTQSNIGEEGDFVSYIKILERN